MHVFGHALMGRMLKIDMLRMPSNNSGYLEVSIETFWGQNRNCAIGIPSFDSAKKVDCLGPKKCRFQQECGSGIQTLKTGSDCRTPYNSQNCSKVPTKLRGTSEYPFKVLETLRLESQSLLSKVPKKIQSKLPNTLYFQPTWPKC